MLKVIFTLVLLYFILRAVRNLFRAAIGGSQAPPRVPPRQQTPWNTKTERPPYQAAPHPSPTPPVDPLRKEPTTDIEDAKWQDL